MVAPNQFVYGTQLCADFHDKVLLSLPSEETLKNKSQVQDVRSFFRLEINHQALQKYDQIFA